MRSAGREREEKRRFLERGETGKPPRPRR